MIDRAKQRGGDDNITVIVAGVSGDVPPLVAGETISETLEVLQEFDPPLHGADALPLTGPAARGRKEGV
jgi:hypothetical protein